MKNLWMTWNNSATQPELRPTARAKTDSHIVIGLLPRYKDGRQLHDDKILYINRRLKAMSHDKGFYFVDVYCAFNEKVHIFKDGLDTSVSIATQVDFWTKRSQPSSPGKGEGLPPIMGAP